MHAISEEHVEKRVSSNEKHTLTYYILFIRILNSLRSKFIFQEPTCVY